MLVAMDLTRLARTVSVVTTVLWTAKAVAIAVAGGLGRSPLEGPLFLLGLVACVVAAALVGMTFAQKRSTAVRIVASVAGVVAAAVYGTLEGAVVSLLQPAHPGWVWGELNLWVLMLTLLAVASLRRGGLSTRTADPVPAV
jgi:hypothetical protein